MLLIPKSQLYGQPAREVRDLLRFVSTSLFEQGLVRSRLGIRYVDARVVLAGLLADGYIDLAEPGGRVPRYRLNMKGVQLALARFAPQITRAVGEELLASVLERVADQEAMRPFAYEVKKLALFGSMLGSAPVVSDLDIAIEVVPRFGGGEQFDRLSRERIRVAEQRGKCFRGTLDYVSWPRREVTEYIRGGSKYISLHSFGELARLMCPFRVVFEAPKTDACPKTSG